MTSINIPKNVTSIGNNTLGCCVNLTSITVASDNCVYDSRDNCNGIIRTEDNCLIIGCDCTIIPNSVTRIGDWAYSYSLIKSINIPASVTNIGENLFIGCDSLTSITVANDNSIYDSRDNCNAIIRTKDNCLIRGCKGTVIPDGVTIIAKDAFVDCDIKTINIPTSVTSIEFNAFSSCDSITSINIPESVTSIGDRAFIYCSGLKSINIPTSITSIGEDTFYGCQNLTSINIPENVTSIGKYAFSHCQNLTSINIPESVTSIGDNAFYGCISIDNIYCYGSTPAELGPTTFTIDTYNEGTLHVPYGTIDAYKTTGWRFFLNIVEFDPTDVKTVSAGDKTAKELRIYDLNGVRMAAPQRGLNIINGKKVMY